MRARLHRVGGLSGPAVVFIHGYGADRLSWLAVAPMLQDVAQVFAVDLPGHGAADDDVGQGTAAELALAVERALAQIAGPLHLVGHSLGGLVALHLRSRDTARFPVMALLAPAGVGARADVAFLRAYPELRSAEAAQALLRHMVAKPRHMAPAMVRHVLASLDQIPARRAGLGRIAEALIVAPPLPAATLAGVLILWGEEDRILPLPASLEPRRLPGVGHIPQIEAASAVQRVLREAVAEITVGRA